MKYFFLQGICICLTFNCLAQGIGIGTSSPDASAQLDITNASKGLLIPRMSTAAFSSILNPARGLMVYDSVKNQLMVNMGSSVSPDWQTIVFKSGWSLSGNNAVNAATQFIGTTDSVMLRFKVKNQPAGLIDPAVGSNTSFGFGTFNNVTTGTGNTAFGSQALRVLSSGNYNVANGTDALYYNTSGGWNVANGYTALYSNTTGSYNVANGVSALGANTSGQHNVANGTNAMFFNTTGSFNVSNGSHALKSNTTGNNNTATGHGALTSNTYGIGNTATGYEALRSNNGGEKNVATGFQALYANTSGFGNVAAGASALGLNTTGVYNVATGFAALNVNTTGGYNLAYGNNALYLNSTGNYNVAVGSTALFSNTVGHSNVAIGYESSYYNVNGIRNTAVGHTAGNNNGTNPSNFTALGYNAGHLGSNSNTIEIGNSSVGWIGGMVGWSTYFSDERAKTGIDENVPGISFIKKLRPVTYHLDIEKQNALLGIKDTAQWEGKYDIEKKLQSGFVAQEVEAAAKALNYDFNGVAAPEGNRKLYSMQYSAFVVPLVKAVQEQQQIIEQQQQQIDALRLQLQQLMKTKTE